MAAARALPVWATPLLFAGGWAYWVLLEYLIHRFVFHADAALPGVAGAMLLHFLFHGDLWLRLSSPPYSPSPLFLIPALVSPALLPPPRPAGVHHKFPKDCGRIVMPPLIAVLVCALHWTGVFAPLPPAYRAAWMSGALWGYVVYDSLHA